ncbi:extensin family protein [Sorangium sp. So ce362]|uniref:extensin family protein n=1 Tax=Sorangium sp. So ce362 TaxID=3133303 RepID=UPI003F63FAFB
MAFSRLRCLLKPLACALLASSVALGPAPALAASPFLMTPAASVAEASPAYRYANMTDDEAMAELDRRKILYLRVDRAPGVRAPIRLTGRLNGVYFHSVLPPEQRVASMFEILDARLALALDDFAVVLSRHDIDEVVHYTMYRPNVPMPGRGGGDDEAAHGHGHGTAQAKAADRDVRKESTRSAPPVELGKKGALDGTSKAPEERPRRLKEKGAAEGGAKEKGAKEKGAKEGGAKEGGAKEKGTAEGGAKEKGATAAARSAASSAPGKPARTTAARSAPVKAAGKTGARRAAHREPVTSTRATASPAKRRGGVALRSDAGQKPRGDVAPRSDAGQKPRGDVAPRSDAGQKPRGAWAPPGTRHPAGLAIDVGALKKRDGTWISVARHFHGRIGDKTCGEGAPQPELPEARELRSIVCEAADLGIFTYVLTPNYNAPHADHYHMEIKPGVRWFLYH